jgi:PAS domain S-box-containing protein
MEAGGSVPVSRPPGTLFETRLSNLRDRVASLRGNGDRADPTAEGDQSVELDGIASGLEDLASAHRALDGELSRYREVFDLAPQGHLVTTPAGQITEANPASVRLLQGNRNHLVGKPVAAFVEPETRREFINGVAKALRGGNPGVWEVRMRRNSRDPFVALVTVAAIRDRSDDLVALHWTLRTSPSGRWPRRLWHIGRATTSSLDWPTAACSRKASSWPWRELRGAASVWPSCRSISTSSSW